MMRTLAAKIAIWFITWIVGSFLAAVMLGTSLWYIFQVFGWEAPYFPFVRNMFVACLVFDIILDMLILDWCLDRRMQ